MYKFTDTNFTPKQKRNYKFLGLLYTLAGWFATACLLMPFGLVLLRGFLDDVLDYEPNFPSDDSMLQLFIGSLVFWGFSRVFVANRCLNCFKYGLKVNSEQTYGDAESWKKFGVVKGKYNVLQLLVVQQVQCKKCGFECERITQRTGNYEGIGRMHRDIKKGGKPRLPGEDYTSWWRRNK